MSLQKRLEGDRSSTDVVSQRWGFGVNIECKEVSVLYAARFSGEEVFVGFYRLCL